MKKFTHAWIAFKAIERLQNTQLSQENRAFADYLIEWFQSHKDGVIRGAWYPDEIIKDNGSSHIMKYVPDLVGANGNSPAGKFRVLPSSSLIYQSGKSSPLHNKPYLIDPKYNLPERCEALSHAVIDNLRIIEREEKGSPLAPTANHAALVLFMLSHYIADAHMPLHCDARPGELDGWDLHAAVEEIWEYEVVAYYEIDRVHQRFLYNPRGYPKLRDELPQSITTPYADSILKAVEDELASREFQVTYGQGNDNVREFMQAVSQYSYLLSYSYLPAGYDPASLDHETLQVPGGLSHREMSITALSDAVDAIARVWLRDLRRYMKWEKESK